MTSFLNTFGRKRGRAFFLVRLFGLISLLLCALPPPAPAETLKKELLFGIEPEHNIFDQMQKYRILAGYLSDQLGVEVKLTIMSRYGEVIKRFKSLHLDGALLSSYTATLAMKDLYLDPLAYLVNENDVFTSQGYILVRKDSGIKNISDMEGKSVVYVDPATTEGYIFARAFFRGQGIDPDTYFSSQDFSGSHASAVYAVLDGRAEIGSAKDTVYNDLISKEPSIRNELMIFAKSPPVPEVTLCVKSDLDHGLLEKLRAVLFGMDKTVEGYKILKQLEARRFAPAGPDDFAVVEKMAAEAGLDLPAIDKE